jgi:hypothetical protein
MIASFALDDAACGFYNNAVLSASSAHFSSSIMLALLQTPPPARLSVPHR